MFIYENYELPSVNLHDTVQYGDSEFTSEGKDFWTVVKFLSSGAGRKGVSLLQVDLYTRARGRVDGGVLTSGDRLATLITAAEQLFIDAMRVRSIQIYDFTNRSSPVLLTNRKIIVQNGEGKFKEPDSTQVLDDLEDNLNRRTLTYRLRLLDDAAQAKEYDD
jgi:hypothetical protein